MASIEGFILARVFGSTIYFPVRPTVRCEEYQMLSDNLTVA